MTSSTKGENLPVTGMEVFSRTLIDRGVLTMFGVMGDANLGWLSAWAQTPGTRYVAARHEAGAVSMADGYAVDSSSVGVSTTTYGPGLLNAMNALCTAVRNRRPQVLIIGSTPVDKPHHVQKYDHEGLVGPTGAKYRKLVDPQLIDASVSSALRESRESNTVVVLDVATECLEESAQPQWRDERRSESGSARPDMSDGSLQTVAHLLGKARRPVILAGVGAEVSQASPALVRLAETIDGTLSTTLAVRGLFAGEVRDIGVFGGFATPATQNLLHQADTVIAFGASLNEFTSHNGHLLDGKMVIQVDSERSALGRQYPVDMMVHADARIAAEKLVGFMAEGSGSPASSYVGMETADAGSHIAEVADQSDDLGIDPRYAMSVIDRWLPDNRVVVTDGGHFVEWPSRYLRAPHPGSFRTALAGGSIGLGLPQALGMSVNGRADAYAIVVGDGGFFMSLVELETAVRHRIPLVVLVMNDEAYSAEVHKLRSISVPAALAYFEGAPDIAAVAQGFGAKAVEVNSIKDLDNLPDLQDLEGPLVVDLHVTPSVVSSRLAAAVT